MTNAKHGEYDELRQVFYEFFRLRILHTTGFNIEASAIEYALLDQTMDWANRQFPWDWFEIKRRFRNIPARFELAVSVGGELCGLIIGKPSRGRRHLSAYFLEGNPDSNHPLKGQVLPILLDGMALYGEVLGCSFIRLIQPVENLTSRYKRAGFQFVTNKGSRIYCEKPMRRS